MSGRELACNEVVELVNDYLEGAMPPAERARFELHLGECPYCVTYLEQMRMTVGAVGRLREETAAALMKRAAAHNHLHHGSPESITPEIEAAIRKDVVEV